MPKSVELSHNGRHLEFKASMIAGDWQIWIYEAGTRIYFYGVVPNDQAHELDAAIRQAKSDVETDAIIVPVIRSWPRGQRAQDEAR